MDSPVFDYFNRKQQANRGRQLRALARHMHLQYEGKGSHATRTLFDALVGTQSKAIHNVMQGHRGWLRFYLFDYSYVTRRGSKYPFRHTQTALAVNLQSPPIILPKFILRPKQFSDYFKKLIGYAYLRAPDGRFALLSFDAESTRVQQFFDCAPPKVWRIMPPDTILVSNGTWFTYTRKGRQIAPAQAAVSRFIDRGMAIFNMLARRHFPMG